MTVRFGEFRLDLATRQVLRGDRNVPLSPKAFALFHLLLSERPRAISKRELFERVWPSVFVSDATLASVVAELRRGLADNARRPRYIRTLHGFGYAFCGTAADEPSDGPCSRCELVWSGGRVPLVEGENVLGRGTTPALALAGSSVSRRHARIMVSGTGAMVEDLGSKNGTLVGATRISKPTAVADGDEIKLGSVALMFRVLHEDESTRTTDLARPPGRSSARRATPR